MEWEEEEEEGGSNKRIYSQTLIIPNLEERHKEERMCKEPWDTKASGRSKGELRVTSSTGHCLYAS